MEWADEPPPLILLYQVGFGWVIGMRCQKGGGVGVGGWGKGKRSENMEARAGQCLVDRARDSIHD